MIVPRLSISSSIDYLMILCYNGPVNWGKSLVKDFRREVFYMTDTVSMQKPRAKQPLLTLQAKVSPNGQVDSTIPISWCVSKQLVQQLKDMGFDRPHLLLVVRSKETTTLAGETIDRYQDTGYYVAPLTQEMMFVNFGRPGNNEVVPVVVNVEDQADAKTLDTLRHTRSSSSTILDEDGRTDSWRMPFNAARLPQVATNFTLEVNVPKEMFAREPRPATKAFVGRFFHGKGDDQCGFRRRLIASSLAVVPFVILGNVLKVVLLLVALVLTKREYNLRHLLHPYSGSVTGVIDDTDNDTLFWWQDKRGRKRPWPFFVFNHLVLFALPAVVYAAFHLTDSKTHKQWSYKGWWDTFFLIGGWYVAIALLVALVAGLGLLVGMLTNTEKARQRRLERKEQQYRAQQTAEQRRQEQVLRELNAMVCSTSSLNRSPSLQALPANKRTVTLRFYDLKTKVCKPFAR